MRELLEKVKELPRRVEAIGGQNFSYVQLGELIGLIEAELAKPDEAVAWLWQSDNYATTFSQRTFERLLEAQQLKKMHGGFIYPLYTIPPQSTAVIEQLIAERDALKARIDELESNLKLSRTRLHMANAKNNNLKLTIRNQANSIDNLLRYKARIDGGIRASAFRPWKKLYQHDISVKNRSGVNQNCIVILDEGVEI